LPLDDPERVAEMVIERLRDAGFVIKPADEPGAPTHLGVQSFLQLRNRANFGHVRRVRQG
jgi:hypothetical protein